MKLLQRTYLRISNIGAVFRDPTTWDDGTEYCWMSDILFLRDDEKYVHFYVSVCDLDSEPTVGTLVTRSWVKNIG